VGIGTTNSQGKLDDKIFLEGFSRDGNGHASEVLITVSPSLLTSCVFSALWRFKETLWQPGDIRLANADCADCVKCM
jgi:hypothetical protein